MVCTGLSYSERVIIVLPWRMAAAGKHMFMMTESKFDDFPRNLASETVKAKVLSPYKTAIVGGLRLREYPQFLNFGDKQILPDYDPASLDRIRRQG